MGEREKERENLLTSPLTPVFPKRSLQGERKRGEGGLLTSPFAPVLSKRSLQRERESNTSLLLFQFCQRVASRKRETESYNLSFGSSSPKEEPSER